MDTQEYNAQLGEALSKVVTPDDVVVDKNINLSSGVVLKPKKVTPFIFQSVASQFKDPPVPTVYMEEKGREELNPMHPNYLLQVAEVNEKRSMATMDAIIALGTSLVHVPDDFESPDDEGWIDDLEAIGIIIDRTNKRMRYRTWVKYIAAPSAEDMERIISKVLRSAGVTEGAVVAASANFQSKA